MIKPAVAVLLALAALTAACGPDTTPTPPSKLEGFTVTKETTGHDLVALLSESEAECVRASREWVLDMVLVESIIDDWFPTTCLTPADAGYVGIAAANAKAGGLRPGTLSCLNDYMAGKRVIPIPEERDREWPFTVNFYICLTDGEARTLGYIGAKNVGFKPSELRCMVATREGMKAMTRYLTPSDAMIPMSYTTYVTLEERAAICRPR